MATEQDLDNKLTELKQAVADAADRVSKKLDDLAKNNPDLTDEIGSVQEDIDALKQIAPDTEPAPEPAPEPGSGNGQ